MRSAMTREFVEAAARAMWEHEFNAEALVTCKVCGHHLDAHSYTDGPCTKCTDRVTEARDSVMAAKVRGDNANYGPGLRRLDRASRHWFAARDPLAPDSDVPQDALLSAAMLLGALQQANGCELEVIVRAAYDAERLPMKNKLDANCLTEPGGGCVGTSLPCMHWPEEPPLHYVRDFASAVAMMAMGTGVSWFDDHAEFTLRGNWRFIVPAIEFHYDDEEINR